jgi:methionyl-tRNA synthetase
VLTDKYFAGKVPDAKEFTKEDVLLMQEITKNPEKISTSLENYKFREALAELMNLARLGNKYLADTEPWKLIKTDENRVKSILYLSLQICANLSIVMEPFMPFSSEKLKHMLNFSNTNWNNALKADNLLSNHQLGKAELLFSKIEDEEIAVQIKKLEDSKSEIAVNSVDAKIENAKPDITYEEFSKMDIRIGTILEAEHVPKTDKLLKLLIDTGFDKRTVVSGIAGFFKPENIIGQQVSILVNLAPRKIKGIESQGMILMAENNRGELTFVSPIQKMNEGSSLK